MYWFNLKCSSLERVVAPSTDEEATQVLAGHPDSATFVSERDLPEQGHSFRELKPYPAWNPRLGKASARSPEVTP